MLWVYAPFSDTSMWRLCEDAPKDACKYLQIEEFRCLNVTCQHLIKYGGHHYSPVPLFLTAKYWWYWIDTLKSCLDCSAEIWKRFVSSFHEVHQYQTQPEAAAKKCMKWWDVTWPCDASLTGHRTNLFVRPKNTKELQKCQWDQSKSLGLWVNDCCPPTVSRTN